MVILVLSVLVVLAVAGCACVVWASRGGPRWVRGVASATVMAGELVRKSSRSQKNSGPGSQSGSVDG
ncbi:hypothetical protein ACFXAZ_36395 [Streptomyces sp. NPDC059477]|uniref:hypothetical protein n=1 Tax=Streptomyces sp. NPDC059477 TaxID=3346847 RepID=UPI0036BCEC2C